MMLRAYVLVSLAVCSVAYIQLMERDYKRMLDKNDGYSLNASTYTRIAFDDGSDLLYVISREPARLTVFHLDAEGSLTERFTHKFPVTEGEPQDVEFCESNIIGQSKRLAISFNAANDPSQDGEVHFYRAMKLSDLTLHKYTEFVVGAQPVDMEFAQGCTRIVVACTGRPFMAATETNDPDGEINIAYLPDNLQEASIAVTTVTFNVSDQIDDLESKYFRREPKHVGAVSVPVQKNVEPVNVIVAPHGMIAYVAAPKNNAIFRVTLGDGYSYEVFPSGRREWANFYMDASKADNLMHMQNYRIYSTLMPKQIQWVTQGEADWLITLDTGFLDSIPEYGFQDWGIASQLVADGMVSVDSELLAQLKNNTRLGEAYISVRDGLNEEGNIGEVYVFGGRGITIHDGITLDTRTGLVDNLERVASQFYGSVFNTGLVSAGNTPVQDKEATSPTMGPNLSVMETGQFGGNKVLFMGSGSSGMLYVYVLKPDADCPQPYFHSVHRRGGQSESWQTLYDKDNIGDLGITDMLYIGKSDDHDKLLIVASATSNSVSTYSVQDNPVDLRRRRRDA